MSHSAFRLCLLHREVTNIEHRRLLFLCSDFFTVYTLHNENRESALMSRGLVKKAYLILLLKFPSSPWFHKFSPTHLSASQCQPAFRKILSDDKFYFLFVILANLRSAKWAEMFISRWSHNKQDQKQTSRDTKLDEEAELRDLSRRFLVSNKFSMKNRLLGDERAARSWPPLGCIKFMIFGQRSIKNALLPARCLLNGFYELSWHHQNNHRLEIAPTQRWTCHKSDWNKRRRTSGSVPLRWNFRRGRKGRKRNVSTEVIWELFRTIRFCKLSFRDLMPPNLINV